MRGSLLSIAAASVLLAGVGLASAQTSSSSTSTTWTNEDGSAFRQYSNSQHYSSFTDPSMKPSIGMELPRTVTVYPLPETMKVPDRDRYSYGMVNDRPVVVERTTRKVVHTWDQQ